MNLTKLLKPEKFAIIGATEKETYGGFAVKLMELHAADRLEKDIYLVNPGRDQVFGHKCYRSVADCPSDIDMVIIATAKKTVPDLLRQSAAKGAKGAVVFAAGYGETGKPEDKAAEQDLKALCKELDIALMGPNCAGYINVPDSIPAMGFMTTVPHKRGHVGLVSQSGMICTLLLDSGKTDFSYVISCGNSKIVEVIDYIDFLVDDEDTKVIVSYIEGVTNPQKFVSILKKAALKKKPVILLKIGRSEKGSKSASSHTGSLSGSDAAFEAIFKKYGVIRVDDLEDLASLANMIDTIPALPKGDRVVSLNGSGGENGVACDVGAMYNINYPDFSEQGKEALKGVLAEFATINNPLDTTADICYDTDQFADAAELIINDENFDMAVVGITIVNELTDLCVKHMSEGLIKLRKEGRVTKPIFVIPAVESGRMPEYVQRLKEVGIPVTAPCSYGYKHIAKLAQYVNWLKETDIDSLEAAIPETENTGRKAALSEHSSKELLKGYGIPVPDEVVATSEEGAVAHAKELGFPLVMKVESADILHKTDAGGVKLNIRSEEEVRAAYQAIMKSCVQHCPNAKINGILMQQMLKSGTEVIVGVTNDPALGPMVLCGMGGVFTEVFKDVSLFPAPLSRADALKMIQSLKAFKMMTGYRGQPKLDVDALAQLLVNVGRFAVDHANDLVEMDINPVFVYPEGEGVAAADALVILRE
ncbi:acetate--CoA ligase family protein [Bacilliculturomica massiliensis]|uniref:acetate--CoA ligase family protein n=1 Tax=Bacilliculturomica massiliensis TaxID=1917867 RepID=UPI00102F3D06|nr:acetate--CoA ligase family protein [Bacilliculturomica massiliensis]